MRNGRRPTDDPTGDFAKIDQLLPKKPNQTDRSRANAIEQSINWLRNKEINPAFDDGDEPFKKMVGEVPVSTKSPDERLKDVEAVETWLRNPATAVDDETRDFSVVNQLLPNVAKSPTDRAREIESVIDWCRNRGVPPISLLDTPEHSKVLPIPITVRSPEERKKDVDDVMTWMRNGKNPEDDPTGCLLYTSDAADE